jgi:hypothetical protein
MVSQETKPKLPDNCTGRCSNFDRRVRRTRQSSSLWEIHVSNHDICKINGEDIVGIGVTEKLAISQFLD